MSLAARQRKLLAKKKEEQRKVWDLNDGKEEKKVQEKPVITKVTKVKKEKIDEIISCPFCGHLAKTSEMPKHNVIHPNLIIKGIYLGGYENARDKETLKDKLKITHVLNCATELNNYFPKIFKYRKLDLMDREKQNISSTFETAFEFIDQALQYKKGKCFVHCQEGKSRSVTIVAAYLMSRHKFSLDNALATITSKRRLAQPNKGFLKELRNFEEKLQDDQKDNLSID